MRDRKKGLLAFMVLVVLPAPGVAQQVTKSDLVGAWRSAAAPARDPSTGLEGTRTTLFFNADGTRNWAYTGGQWRVADDTLKFLGSHRFELQGNSLKIEGVGERGMGEFTRSDSGAKSGLVGMWVGGYEALDQKKLVLNADSTFSWGPVNPKRVGTWQLIGDTISDAPNNFMYVATLQSSGQELVLKKLQQRCPDPKDQKCSVPVWVTDPAPDGTQTYSRVKP